MCRDRLDYTQRLFEQLPDCGYGFDHFILDNGSTDGTFDWLKKNTKARLIPSGDNKGLWRGIELICTITNNFEGYDLVLKLDNDMEFPERDWLRRLVNTYMNSTYDVLSPFVEGICNGAGGPQRVKTEGNIGRTGHVGGACLLARRELYDKEIPNYGKAMGWDAWFCEGLKCGVVEDIHVKHDTLAQERDKPDYYARKVKESNEKY